jgi:hypothetical protein
VHLFCRFCLQKLFLHYATRRAQNAEALRSWGDALASLATLDQSTFVQLLAETSVVPVGQTVLGRRSGGGRLSA